MMREGGPGESGITSIVKDGTWIISCNAFKSYLARSDFSYFTERELGISGIKQLD